MDAINEFFERQQKIEDEISLIALTSQISINLGATIIVMLLFNWLRPRFDQVYAPKTKTTQHDMPKAAKLGTGWLDWIKPIIKTKDVVLLEMIGFDAYTFIYFVGVLRELILILTSVSLLVFVPINVFAGYQTGNWPPNKGFDFMSIAAVNYQYGKQSHSANYHWYWSTTVAVWSFTIIVLIQLMRSSERFIKIRKKYIANCQQRRLCSKTQSSSQAEMERQEEVSSRTLMVHFEYREPKRFESVRNQPYQLTPHVEIQQWIDSLTSISSEQLLVGKYNPDLYEAIDDYDRTVKHLEKKLNSYLCRLEKQKSHVYRASVKRPTAYLNWGLQRKDAINYYTEKASTLATSIQRNRSRLKQCNYAWIVYPTLSSAEAAFAALAGQAMKDKKKSAVDIKCVRVRFAPKQDDIIWSNINIEPHTIRLKRRFGYGLFFSVAFIWSLPIALLGLFSNFINFIRFFPGSSNCIDKFRFSLGILQSYMSPCLMILMHVKLVSAMRYISRQQAYKTNSDVEQQSLWKLFLFFISNNLVIFALVNIMIGITGQITSIVLIGSLPSQSYSDYLQQIAKNMVDVSNFWINFVCVRSVGVLVGLLRIPSLYKMWRSQKLATIEPSHILTTPSFCSSSSSSSSSSKPLPHSDSTSLLPYFKFTENYNRVICFFVAALVFSVATPIILPFTLMYFSLVTLTYKYQMMYVYATKTETEGLVWPLLIRIIIVSLIALQGITVLLLSLKSVKSQLYLITPLPFLTVIVGFLYLRRLNRCIRPRTTLTQPSTVSEDHINDVELNEVEAVSLASLSSKDCQQSVIDIINSVYRDPALFKTLVKPNIPDHLKNLVQDVYANHMQKEKIMEMLFTESSQNSYLTPIKTSLPIDSSAHGSAPSLSSASINTHAIRSDKRKGEELYIIPTSPFSEQVSIINSLGEAYTEKQPIQEKLAVSQHQVVASTCLNHSFLEDHSSVCTHTLPEHLAEPQSMLANDPEPSAPTLDELLGRNRKDSIDVPLNEHLNHVLLVPHVPPPTYADSVVQRHNLTQHATPQKSSQQHQRRRHST